MCGAEWQMPVFKSIQTHSSAFVKCKTIQIDVAESESLNTRDEGTLKDDLACIVFMKTEVSRMEGLKPYQDDAVIGLNRNFIHL